MSANPRLRLQILSPDGVSIERAGLTSVNVPLADGGSIGIKPGHARLIAETVRGDIRFSTEEGENKIDVHPGILEIRENTVIILTSGKVTQHGDFVLEPAQIDYNRLMQTLTSKTHPKD